MTRITHKQAQNYIHLAADGLLRDDEDILLNEHLHECISCSSEAEQFIELETRLKQTLQGRWDDQNGPSKKLLVNIRSQTKRIMISKRINMGLKYLAGLVLLVVLVFVSNSIFSYLRTSPARIPASTVLPTNFPTTVYATPRPSKGLIAFVSKKSGNDEIYTMQSDGSNITNLTNNPANDGNPIWSPDGKRIAFESNRDGHVHILIMKADGSSVVRLINDNADDQLGLDYRSRANIWSPDGEMLVITRNPSKTVNIIRYVVNADGSGAIRLVDNTLSPVWSPDGKKIAYAVENPQNLYRFQIFIANADGRNTQSIINNHDLLNAPENPGEIVMKWSADGQSIYFMLTSSPYEDGMRWRIFRVIIDSKNVIQLAESTSPIDGWSGEIPYLVYPTLSPQGWNWFRTDGKSNVYLKKWNPTEICGNPNINFDTFASPDVSYLWSPDNTKLAVGVYCSNDKGWWFFRMNADNLEVSQLTIVPFLTNGAHNLRITSWSPDSKSILFTIQNINDNPIGNVGIYTLEVEGGSVQPVQLTSYDINSGSPIWQPQP